MMLKFNFFTDCFDCAADKLIICWRKNFIIDDQPLCFFVQKQPIEFWE